MGVPRTKTGVKALLGAQGIHPRRLHGQNFLVDGNLIDAIVRDAEVGPGDAVLEVGTGTGILTDALAARAGAVLSVDIDGRLQAITRGLQEWPPHVRFLEADILDGKHKISPVVRAAFAEQGAGFRPRVVANLPYSIATPLLATLLWEGFPIHDATVLVQREAADRFVAPVGSREYGPMAVAVGLLAEARVLRPVGRKVFWPEPRVDSALLHLVPKNPSLARSLRDAEIPRRLQEAFGQRRKTLRRLFAPEVLAACGISSDARPQELDPATWLRLLTVPSE